ncbi:MAG: 1,4-dihydroxy-2-naphthoate octaprenyltransferase [Chloroflexota bacterium]
MSELAAARPPLAIVWLRSVRPFSFTASIVPVCLAAGCAAVAGEFWWVTFALTLIGAVSLHCGTNLTNDYFDWKQGADHPESLGPSPVIQQRWLAPSTVLIAGLASFGVGCLAGFALTVLAGWRILAIGLVGVPLAYGYTAPPLRLAYRGLGELNVFLLMGPLMVVGSYLAMAPFGGLRLPILLSIPVGLLVAAILHANNIRDLEDDRRLGKRTFATIVGLDWARREFDALVLGAYAFLAVAAALGAVTAPTLVGLISVPLALRARATIWSGADPGSLAPAVKQSAALHLVFGLTVTAGLVFNAVVR